ncbi:sulfotransferase family protein [Marinobacter sp.]|uniref:sulfotransferase family protein n=1 Tax=Marinobacter sp. TaxID=50741 RepID=UPI0035615439
MKEYKQIFIIGAPRSGTTFLASLLDKTAYGQPVETHFITKYYKKLDSYGDISNFDNFRSLVEDILNERPVQQWGLSLNVKEFYRSFSEEFGYKDIVNKILSLQKKDGNPYSWGDKTPHYIGDLEILLALFPHARYIYIVRDGRDVALSLLEKSWGPSNVYECARYWAKLNNKTDLINKLMDNGQLYSLTYESLLDETKSHIRSIYDFLGEQVSEQEVDDLSSSVKNKNYGKWKTKMKKGDIRTFEAEAGGELSRLGYEVNYPGAITPSYKKIGYAMHSKFRRAYFLFHINVIDGFKIRFLGKSPFNE